MKMENSQTLHFGTSDKLIKTSPNSSFMAFIPLHFAKSMLKWEVEKVCIFVKNMSEKIYHLPFTLNIF
jgi:hypothetical protein